MVVIQAPIEITTPTKRYPPVGHCIYCGVYSNKLTNEHIIAHGLAGNSLILPKSSCRGCADKTRDSETACLRHLWWPFRTRIGAPSSGKQPPKSFTVREMKVTKVNADGSIDAYDKIAEKAVGPMEFPFVFMAYKFPPPGLVIGRDPDAGIKYEVMARISKEEFQKFAPGDKDGFKIAQINVDAYCRMLAKIAHSYAVAELGWNSFRPVLAEFICGKVLERGWHWIGGDTELPPPEQHLHDIKWGALTVNGTNYVMVSLRLFSFIGSPRYDIVVGELIRPLNELPFLQQPVYTIDVKAALPLGELVLVNQGPGGIGS
jgi:hypothetical protein